MSGLTNFDIQRYARQFNIPHFRGVFMRDTLPTSGPWKDECAIVNLNTSQQPGSHWVCYYKKGDRRVYFDSFGQVTPMEVQKYLKTKQEVNENRRVIQRNTDIVQSINSSECGQICLMVLHLLAKGLTLQSVISLLRQRKYGYT